MSTYGVSFSVKQCRNFKVEPAACLQWLIEDMGFKRFRLMSYWNEIEKTPGKYDFGELDRQFQQIQTAKGQISLCLGARQPRWPENHWPDWVLQLPPAKKSGALLQFVETVVERYKDYPNLVSYQLENEALLKDFGEHAEINRPRLRQEFKLVKRLDPKHPVIMTTSTSWGIPLRRPIPDIVGFSYYHTVYRADLKAYTVAFHKAWLQSLRALAIKILWRKPSFIHELQLEPWGPANIWEMSVEEQDNSMSPSHIQANLAVARQTKLPTVDLWGGEWWYWRSVVKNDRQIAETVKESVWQK